MSLPSSFPSPVHLPFNRDCIGRSFQSSSPECRCDGETVWVLLRGTDLLVSTSEPPHLPQGTLPDGLEALSEGLFIGTWEGKPCRVLSLAKGTEIPAGLSAESLLSSEPRLPMDLLTLGGIAGQILHWEKNSRFCSRCGNEMDRLSGEWGKKCRGCGYDHFPHIHPCVIVLVRRPGEVLLTRKAAWPAGRYSLVAGFVDFGECLEEAVAREVLEETGVRVKNIRYVGSQSWPFPSQVMAGFTAEYDSGEVRVEEKELEDARWFSVEDLPLLPPRRSIARFLLDHHLRG